MSIVPNQILTHATGKCAECQSAIYASGEIWTCEGCGSQFSVVHTALQGYQEPFQGEEISYGGPARTIYQVLRGPSVRETTTKIGSDEPAGGSGRMELLLGQTEELTQVQVAVKPMASHHILNHLYTGYDDTPWMDVAEKYIDSVLKRPKLPVILAEASELGDRVTFKDPYTHQTEKRLPEKISINDRNLGLPGYGSGVKPGTPPTPEYRPHTAEEMAAEQEWLKTLGSTPRPSRAK